MTSSKVEVHLCVKRFDVEENPTPDLVKIELDRQLEYSGLKQVIERLFHIDGDVKKVIKVRNKNNVLMPMSELLKGNTHDNPFIIEVFKIHHTIPLAKNNANLLQDAYLDAIRQKIRTMESRVSQAELLIPQLQWRRQAHMDETVSTLSSRVAFLNRRIDELLPAEWKSEMPEKIIS